jgi:hypothetical protein
MENISGSGTRTGHVRSNRIRSPFTIPIHARLQSPFTIHNRDWIGIVTTRTGSGTLPEALLMINHSKEFVSSAFGAGEYRLDDSHLTDSNSYLNRYYPVLAFGTRSTTEGYNKDVLV